MTQRILIQAGGFSPDAHTQQLVGALQSEGLRKGEVDGLRADRR